MSSQLIQSVLLFKRLSQYTAEQIHQVIHDEAPQAIAVILVKLDSKKAKEILGFFPSEDQKDLLYRMATAQSVAPEFLNEVANVIGEKLRVFDPEEKGALPAGMTGQDKMAEILKHMGASKSKELLDALEKKDMGTSDRIKKKMFLFEDIANTEPESLKRSLMSVETETLALALKGSTEEIFNAVLSGLSENRKKMLISELKYMGPQLKSEIDRARSNIVSTLRGFLDQGILRLQGDQSDEEWI